MRNTETQQKPTLFNHYAIWLASLAAITSLYSVTLGIAPFLHADEFMIVDLGRIILQPDTQWSITWVPFHDKPALVWFYLGPIMQEWFFEHVGQYGPRISSLLGALAASFLMLRWLTNRRTAKAASIVLSISFFLDPMFVRSFSLGRLDSWAMALCLLACCIVTEPCPKEVPALRIIKKRAIFVGCFAAIAFFIWPSSVFLFPLILQQLLEQAFANASRPRSLQAILSPLIPLMLSAIIATLLILLPLGPRIITEIDTILAGLQTNIHSGADHQRESFFRQIATPIIEILRSLKYSPVLVVTALFGFLAPKGKGVAFAGLIATLVMCNTLVYISRVQYLLPYLIVLTSLPYQSSYNKSFSQKPFRGVPGVSLALILLWAVGLSVVVRSALAFENPDERKRALVFSAAEKLIGPGNHSVYATPEFYYAGRALGWKMYTPYLQLGQEPTEEVLLKILPHVDYIITHDEGNLQKQFSRLIQKQGFVNIGTFPIYKTPREEWDGVTSNDIRIRNLYSIFRKPYGPYRLYQRLD